MDVSLSQPAPLQSNMRVTVFTVTTLRSNKLSLLLLRLRLPLPPKTVHVVERHVTLDQAGSYSSHCVHTLTTGPRRKHLPVHPHVRASTSRHAPATCTAMPDSRAPSNQKF